MTTKKELEKELNELQESYNIALEERNRLRKKFGYDKAKLGIEKLKKIRKIS